ncbi:MAG: SRPBCC family protein [Patulibacter minatonensis]
MAKLTGESSIEIDAPIDAVWAVVEDVLSAPEWQGGMNSLTALETDADGRVLVAEVKVDGKVKELGSRQRFVYDAPNSLRWSQEKGDMKDVSGAWELESIDANRTKATYLMETDPGRVLGMAIRGPVELALRALLVNPRAGELAKRVEQVG